MASACKIIGHVGGGLYDIELLYDTKMLDDRFTELTTWLTDTAHLAKLSDLENSKNTAQVASLLATNKLSTDIDTLNSIDRGVDPSGYEEQLEVVKDSSASAIEKSNLFTEAKKKYELYKSEFTRREIEKIEITNKLTEPNRLLSVWCADLADGQDGRAIYTTDSIVSLWCIDYHNETYILPPKNKAISNPMNSGVYNIPMRFNVDEQGPAVFVNAALEPGFSTWQPALVEGYIYRASGGTVGAGSCSGGGSARMKIYVAAKEFRRWGFTGNTFGRDEIELVAYDINIGTVDYFAGIGSFESGDRVVINVHEVTADGVVKGEVVGFVSNPKIPQNENLPSCTLQTGLVLYGNHPRETVTTSNGIIKSVRHTGYVDYERTASTIDGETLIKGYLVETEITYSGMIIGDNDWLGTDPDCHYRMGYEFGKFTSREFYYPPITEFIQFDSLQEQCYFVIGGVRIPDTWEKISFDASKDNHVQIETKWLYYIERIEYFNGSVTYNQFHKVENPQQGTSSGDGVYNQTTTKFVSDCNFNEAEAGLVSTNSGSVGGMSIWFDSEVLQSYAGQLVYGSRVPLSSTPVTVSFDETIKTVVTTIPKMPSPDSRNP